MATDKATAGTHTSLQRLDSVRLLRADWTALVTAAAGKSALGENDAVGNAVGGMPFAAFARFAREFDLIPHKISRDELRRVCKFVPAEQTLLLCCVFHILTEQIFIAASALTDAGVRSSLTSYGEQPQQQQQLQQACLLSYGQWMEAVCRCALSVFSRYDHCLCVCVCVRVCVFCCC